MKVVGYLLAACVVLAVLKAAVAALLLTFVVALVWGALFRPAQVFGFVALCAIAGLLHSAPYAFVALFALAVAAGWNNQRDGA